MNEQASMFEWGEDNAGCPIELWYPSRPTSTGHSNAMTTSGSFALILKWAQQILDRDYGWSDELEVHFYRAEHLAEIWHLRSPNYPYGDPDMVIKDAPPAKSKRRKKPGASSGYVYL